jgi:hypothetical protein
MELWIAQFRTVLRLKDIVDDPSSQKVYPGLREFVRRSSPKNHLQHLNCPVFLFHARDDSNEPFATSANLAGELQNLGKRVTFRQAQTGNHYESMIREGIPQAIAWLGTLPGEAPIGVSPPPATNSLETPRPPGTLLENRPAAPPPEPPRQSEPPQPLRPPVRMPRRPLPGRAKSPSF